MIKYVQEDLYPHITEYDCILIGTTTYCTMGNGIQLQVMLNYPYVFEENLKTKYADPSKVGTLIECKKDGEPTFGLCFIAHGNNYRPDLNKEFLSYEGLEKCLKIANVLYKGKRVACPLLGWCKFEGNGDKERIKEIFEDSLTDVDVTVYDYEQQTRVKMVTDMLKRETEVRKVDRKAYYDIVRKRKAEAEERFKKNGHRRY